MKIQAISDLHGHLPELTKCDLLLIAGDICPTDDHSVSNQEKWIKSEFIPWLNELQCGKVIFIAGNHDFWFERKDKEEIRSIFSELTNEKAIYIEDESIYYGYLDSIKYEDNEVPRFQTIKIHGTPRCKQFGNWAFMHDSHILSNYYDKIPLDCDILLCHDAPDLNDQGVIKEGRYKGTNAGNHVLAAYIVDREPKYVIHGHIHSANHDFNEFNKTKMVCVSIKDEKYQPVYEPLTFVHNESN